MHQTSIIVLSLLCWSASAANIAELASSTPQLRQLTSLLTSANLVETLQGPGPFTVFAPTDRAFSRVPRPIINQLTSNNQLLTDVLTYHVVPGIARSSDLQNEQIVETVQGNKLRINIYENTYGPPTITVNGKRVSTVDIEADNGVVHIIDDVIFPLVQDSDTIPAILSNDQENRFSTLLGAVTSANLAETLGGSGPFTLFAPTNEAFAKLPPGTLENLSPQELTNILTLHVTSGTNFAAGFCPLRGVKTLQGQTLKVGHGRHSLVVNSGSSKARIEQPDIAASNGVIHVIDNVLLP